MADIYTRMTDAENKITVLENQHNDTGWIDLVLNTNISNYNNQQKCQYRKVGNKVYIRGVFIGSGVSKLCTVATLPEGFRPSQRIMIPTTGYGVALERIEVETDGTIRYADTNMLDQNIGTKFHSFADTCFLVD